MVLQQLENAWINLAFLHSLLGHLLFDHFKRLHTLFILAGSATLWRLIRNWGVKLSPLWDRLVDLMHGSLTFLLLIEGSPLSKESHFSLLGADEWLWLQQELILRHLRGISLRSSQFMKQVVKHFHLELHFILVSTDFLGCLHLLDLAVFFLVNISWGWESALLLDLVELLDQLLEFVSVYLLKYLLKRLSLSLLWDLELNFQVLLELVESLSFLVGKLVHSGRFVLFLFVLWWHSQWLLALLLGNVCWQFHLWASILICELFLFLVAFVHSFTKVSFVRIILVPGWLELIR